MGEIMKLPAIAMLALTGVISIACQPVTIKNSNTTIQNETVIPRTPEAYENAGNTWGEKLRTLGVQPCANNPNCVVNTEFVRFLKGGSQNFYFTVHDQLKKSFQNGFRLGYQERSADLVLGPNITAAAKSVGEENGSAFERLAGSMIDDEQALARKISNQFSAYTTESEKSLRKGIDVFKDLLAEGSPADRKAFEAAFRCNYRSDMASKLREVSRKSYVSIKPGVENLQVSCSDEVTLKQRMVKIHVVNKATGNEYSNHPSNATYTMNYKVLSENDLWQRLYQRALFEVGKELGSRLSHNLMERADAIEWLRRLSLALKRQSDKSHVRNGFIEDFVNGGRKYFDKMWSEAN